MKELFNVFVFIMTILTESIRLFGRVIFFIFPPKELSHQEQVRNASIQEDQLLKSLARVSLKAREVINEIKNERRQEEIDYLTSFKASKDEKFH